MTYRARAVRRMLAGVLAAALLGGCAGGGQGKRAEVRPVPSSEPRPLPRLIAPPPPPREKPAPRAGKDRDGRRIAPVLERVPTRDRVVFLTVDDGTAKDPEFAELMRAARVPFTMFLTDSMAGDDYGYFDRLRRGGNRVQNHTLTHPSLAGLPYARQRAEICGQQDVLHREFGVRPTLFRAPYGRHDTTTLRAAHDCGLRAAVRWGANMRPDGLRYDNGTAPHRPRLRPGEIVLFHFFPAERLRGGTLAELTRDLLRTITEQGYAVGRLEDYLP